MGNIWTYGSSNQLNKLARLRPNDFLEFVVTASDPLGAELHYALTVTGHHHNPAWQDSNVLSLVITSEHVRKDFGVMLWLKSPRSFHAIGEYDDSITFTYEVLPPL